MSARGAIIDAHEVLPVMTSIADSVPKLVLHPKQPLASISDRAGVITALRNCGLIGADFQAAGATHYWPGAHFLDLVVFLGCSPAVALAPAAGTEPAAAVAAFCNVRIDGPLAQTRFRPGVAQVAPRCPSYRAHVDGWQRLFHNGAHLARNAGVVHSARQQLPCLP